MNLKVILILIPVLRTHAYWKLKWKDEFDQKEIDKSKWEIDEGDTQTCDGMSLQLGVSQKLNEKTFFYFIKKTQNLLNQR